MSPICLFLSILVQHNANLQTLQYLEIHFTVQGFTLYFHWQMLSFVCIIVDVCEGTDWMSPLLTYMAYSRQLDDKEARVRHSMMTVAANV